MNDTLQRLEAVRLTMVELQKFAVIANENAHRALAESELPGKERVQLHHLAYYTTAIQAHAQSTLTILDNFNRRYRQGGHGAADPLPLPGR